MQNDLRHEPASELRRLAGDPATDDRIALIACRIMAARAARLADQRMRAQALERLIDVAIAELPADLSW